MVLVIRDRVLGWLCPLNPPKALLRTNVRDIANTSYGHRKPEKNLNLNPKSLTLIDA